MSQETLTEEPQVQEKFSVESLREKREKPEILAIKKLVFSEPGVRRASKPIDEGRLSAEVTTHYNVTEPVPGETGDYILAREEPLGEERSVTKFHIYNKANDTWESMPGAQELPERQDPSYLGEIDREKYLSVVGTHIDPSGEIDKYWSELYKITNPDAGQLELVAKAPDFSKMLQLKEVSDGIEGFIRMQRGEYESGKICHFKIKGMDELPSVLENVREFTNILEVFSDDEWGGVNDIHTLPDGRLLLVGHIARKVGENKEYFVTASIYDPNTQVISDMKIILAREDIDVDVTPKKPELANVIYVTNSVLDGDNLTLYISVSDVLELAVTIKMA